MAAAHHPALADGQTPRMSTRWLAVLVLLVIAGFGIAFAVAHSISGRTVKDPPRVVTVVAHAKLLGTTAGSVRVRAPGNLENLVVSGGISNLASLPAYNPPSTYTPPSKPTPTPTPPGPTVG